MKKYLILFVFAILLFPTKTLAATSKVDPWCDNLATPPVPGFKVILAEEEIKNALRIRVTRSIDNQIVTIEEPISVAEQTKTIFDSIARNPNKPAVSPGKIYLFRVEKIVEANPLIRFASLFNKDIKTENAEPILEERKESFSTCSGDINIKDRTTGSIAITTFTSPPPVVSAVVSPSVAPVVSPAEVAATSPAPAISTTTSGIGGAVSNDTAPAGSTRQSTQTLTTQGGTQQSTRTLPTSPARPGMTLDKSGISYEATCQNNKPIVHFIIPEGLGEGFDKYEILRSLPGQIYADGITQDVQSNVTAIIDDTTHDDRNKAAFNLVPEKEYAYQINRKTTYVFVIDNRENIAEIKVPTPICGPASATTPPDSRGFEVGVDLGEIDKFDKSSIVPYLGPKWVRVVDITRNQLDAYSRQNINVIYVITPAFYNRGDPDSYTSTVVSNTVRAINNYGNQIKTYEIFNEPDDGWFDDVEGRGKVPPEYFARYLSETYRKVKIEMNRKDIRLISGGLLSSDQTGNPAVDGRATYLDAVYEAGKKLPGSLNWETIKAETGSYPLDGIGYHIYIAEQTVVSDSYITTTIRNYIGEIDKVIQKQDPDKRVWVTEVGWKRSPENLPIGRYMKTTMDTLRSIPSVRTGIWFNLADFPNGKGPYGIVDANGKRSNDYYKATWDTFRVVTGTTIIPPGETTISPIISPAVTTTWESFKDEMDNACKDKKETCLPAVKSTVQEIIRNRTNPTSDLTDRDKKFISERIVVESRNHRFTVFELFAPGMGESCANHRSSCKAAVEACFSEDGNRAEEDISEDRKKELAACIKEQAEANEVPAPTPPPASATGGQAAKNQNFTISLAKDICEQNQEGPASKINIAWTKLENLQVVKYQLALALGNNLGTLLPDEYPTPQAVWKEVSTSDSYTYWVVATTENGEEIATKNYISIQPAQLACGRAAAATGAEVTPTQNPPGQVITTITPAPKDLPIIEVTINGKAQNESDHVYIPGEKVNVGIRYYRNSAEKVNKTNDGCSVSREFFIITPSNEQIKTANCQANSLNLSSEEGRNMISVLSEDFETTHDFGFITYNIAKSALIKTEAIAHINGKRGVTISAAEAKDVTIGGRVYAGGNDQNCIVDDITVRFQKTSTEGDPGNTKDHPVFLEKSIPNCSAFKPFTELDYTPGTYELIVVYPGKSNPNPDPRYLPSRSLPSLLYISAKPIESTRLKFKFNQYQYDVSNGKTLPHLALSKLFSKQVAGIAVKNEDGKISIVNDPSSPSTSFTLQPIVTSASGQEVSGQVRISILRVEDNGNSRFLTPITITAGSVTTITLDDLGGNIDTAASFALSADFTPIAPEDYAPDSVDIQLDVDDASQNLTPTPTTTAPLPSVDQINASQEIAEYIDGASLTLSSRAANYHGNGRFLIYHEGQEESKTVSGCDFNQCDFATTLFELDGLYAAKFCIDNNICSNLISFSTHPIAQGTGTGTGTGTNTSGTGQTGNNGSQTGINSTITPTANSSAQPKVIASIDWLNENGTPTHIIGSGDSVYSFAFPEGLRGEVRIGLVIHYTNAPDEAVTLVFEDGLPEEVAPTPTTIEEPTAEPEATTEPETPTTTPEPTEEPNCSDQAREIGGGRAESYNPCTGGATSDPYCINGNSNTNNCDIWPGTPCTYDEYCAPKDAMNLCDGLYNNDGVCQYADSVGPSCVFVCE